MMTLTARAMQIVLLPENEVHDLHERENKLGHLIPNWNIQEIYHLSTIKAAHHIPDDENAQRKHSDRIEGEIRAQKLLNTENNDQSLSSPERCHSFDWAVRHSSIQWTYAGGRGGRNLKDQTDKGDDEENESKTQSKLGRLF